MYLIIQVRIRIFEKYILVLIQFLSYSSLNPWSSLSDKSTEITFGLLSSVPENASGKAKTVLRKENQS